VVSKIFFAAVSKPHSKDLRYLIFLRFREAMVKFEGAFPLYSTSAVSVPVPVGASQTNTPVGLFDQSRTSEVFVRGFSFLSH
tara:strand:+ start:722 stop:967 length:246 start_codon:yes stop_codon:yes gene_type:complete